MQLIESFTDLDDLVVDPFIKDGVVPVVSLRLGRRFVGCNPRNEEVAFAAQRFAELRSVVLGRAATDELGVVGGE